MDQSLERWLPVPEYEGLYEVSDHGRVRTVPAYLPEDVGQHGHRRVTLCGRRMLVHQLVMRAFVGPPPPGHVVAHGDGDASNNHISNLRWDTQAGNLADRSEHGTLRYGVKHHNATLTDEIVVEMRRLRREGKSFQEIADLFDVPYQRANAAITGKSWGHVPNPCPTAPRKRAVPQPDGAVSNPPQHVCRD